jgi:DNA invertase Pin-like site-specific DNA recombinase
MNNHNPRVAIYARVSTEEQTTDNQVPVLEEMARQRGWEVLKVYAEEASAWKAGRQKQLKELLHDASYHKYDYLLVWSLDRLTREGVGNIFHLVNTFKTYGVSIISNQEPWVEQSGPVADLLTAVTGWVAQFESKRRSERIKAAVQRKRDRGERVGRLPGAKDKKPRRRMGYFERFDDRRK